MSSRDFCFWFQGYLEVGKPARLSQEQLACVKQHLALVFVHEIDPSMGPPGHQEALNHIHNHDVTVRC